MAPHQIGLQMLVEHGGPRATLVERRRDVLGGLRRCVGVVFHALKHFQRGLRRHLEVCGVLSALRKGRRRRRRGCPFIVVVVRRGVGGHFPGFQLVFHRARSVSVAVGAHASVNDGGDFGFRRQTPRRVENTVRAKTTDSGT